MEGQRPGFLRMGVTAASLSNRGNRASRQGGIYYCSDEWGDGGETCLDQVGGDGVQVAVFISASSVGSSGGENCERDWFVRGEE